MIIAIDFDGTCVTHDYPEVGKEIGAVPVIQKLSARSDQIILFTMRSGEHLQHAVDWFAKHGIPLFGVNRNPEQHSWTTSPKPYAHVYIDDAALGIPLHRTLYHTRPFVDWSAVAEMLGIETPKETP